MWRGKTHEAGAVVLKAGVTHHHQSHAECLRDDADLAAFFASCGGGAKIEQYAARDGNNGDVWPNILEVIAHCGV